MSGIAEHCCHCSVAGRWKRYGIDVRIVWRYFVEHAVALICREKSAGGIEHWLSVTCVNME